MIRHLASSIAVATLLLAGCASQPTEACVETTEQEIEALFVRWNNSLQKGAPQVVAKLRLTPWLLCGGITTLGFTAGFIDFNSRRRFSPGSVFHNGA